MEAGFGRATLNLNYAYVGKQWVYPTDEVDFDLPTAVLWPGERQGADPAGEFADQLHDVRQQSVRQNLRDLCATLRRRLLDAGGPPTPLSAPTRNMLSVVRGRPREVGFTLKYNL